jgi:trehalose 6-phosphate synthase
MTDDTLTIVSNRLPVRLAATAQGKWRVHRSDGGLVSALEPMLRQRGGRWVGWSGSSGVLPEEAGAELARHGRGAGFHLQPVELSSREHEVFYEGACNQALWPLLHGLTDRSRLRQPYGCVYGAVNRRFAEVVASVAGGGTVWVHDYHLLQMGEELRRRLQHARLGFFFHTPFPRGEVMLRLPWGASLLPSLLSYDVIGFQTEQDRRNFHAWAGALLWLGSERSAAAQRELSSRTAVFPISVDWDEFHHGAASPSVLARARQIRAENHGRQILLGVDRLDYTKGIPERLTAYERMLERHPELAGRVVFVQLAVPSRTGIDEYERTRAAVKSTVERVNARFTREDWVPVRYVYGRWNRDELLAWYVAADVAVVTPLKDGMNLVAKEFVAANREGGVLVLSRGAGAAMELGEGALLAEPHDTPTLASALHRALHMPSDERRNRLRGLQSHLERNDVHHWASSFLDALHTGRPRPPRAASR